MHSISSHPKSLVFLRSAQMPTLVGSNRLRIHSAHLRLPANQIWAGLLISDWPEALHSWFWPEKKWVKGGSGGVGDRSGFAVFPHSHPTSDCCSHWHDISQISSICAFLIHTVKLGSLFFSRLFTAFFSMQEKQRAKSRGWGQWLSKGKIVSVFCMDVWLFKPLQFLFYSPSEKEIPFCYRTKYSGLLRSRSKNQFVWSTF